METSSERLEARILGPQAEAFVHRQLNDGGVLSRRLLESLDLGSGFVWSYVPRSTDQSVANDLEGGSLYPPAEPERRIIGDGYVAVPVVNESRPLLLDLLSGFLVSNPHAYCVLEDALLRVRDLEASGEDEDFVVADDEVLYYGGTGDSQREKLSDLLSRAESYRLVGILTRVTQGTQIFQARRRLTSTDLATIVQGVDTVFLRAYDGEGYVLWGKWPA